MTLLELMGFLCSMLAGFVLGLLGGGGSILTIPILVYLLGVNPILSTAYSLFVVGTTSLIGSVNYLRKQQVHPQAALLFSVPSFVAIFLARRYVISAIPDPILITETLLISKEVAQMMLFALIMLIAAVFMIADRRIHVHTSARSALRRYDCLLIGLTGLLVGSLTGLIGIGGGFLIVPALVLLGRLPMKKAVGTSLLIITTNALIGFLSSVDSVQIHWPFLLEFTALSILGLFIGSYLSRFISSLKLRRVFGWSVLGLSIAIMAKEILLPTVH